MRKQQANYWNSGKTKFLEVDGKRYPVSGKAEARKLAEKLNATPWNF
jgi:hypothetical protein